jgi:hypothetical protein
MAFHLWHLFSPNKLKKFPEIKPDEAKCLAPLNFWQLTQPLTIPPESPCRL